MHYFISPHNQPFDVGRKKKLKHREVKYLANLARSLIPVLYCLPRC